MENKLLLGMLGGFLGFTLLVIAAVYSFTVDFSFASPEKKIVPQKTTSSIQIDGPLATPYPEMVKAKPSPSPAPSSQTPAAIIENSTLYSLINAYRKEHNLSALRAYTALEISSKRKLESMKANNFWRHENQDGIMDWSVFEQSGYHYSTAGENLSFGNNTPWEIFTAWVNSPEHNEQMLNPSYEDMGLSSDCESYQEVGQKKCVVVLHLGRQQ